MAVAADLAAVAATTSVVAAVACAPGKKQILSHYRQSDTKAIQPHGPFHVAELFLHKPTNITERRRS